MLPSGPILIIGTGLEAERVIHLLRQLPAPPTILGLLRADPNGEPIGSPVCELPVLDTLENIGGYRDRIVGAVPAEEGVDLRESMIAALHREEIAALPVVHPNACLGPGVVLGPGAVVHSNATLDAGTRIGRGAMIGMGTTIGAGTRIGDSAVLEQSCAVGSRVRVGERARLALGSRVVDDLLIGPDAGVGPGSLVLQDVPASTAVFGNPASPVARARHPEVDHA